VGGVQTVRSLLENFRNFSDGKCAPALEGLAERFSFQEFHSDVRRAIIGLGDFVNGDDVRVVDATRGTSLVLKARKEVRVSEEFAMQDLERHGAITYINLFGEEDCAHAPFAESSDKAEAARQPGGKLRLGLSLLAGEASAVTRTVGKTVRVSKLASGTGSHERRQ
jgi:hypothetical protein